MNKTKRPKRERGKAHIYVVVRPASCGGYERQRSAGHVPLQLGRRAIRAGQETVTGHARRTAPQAVRRGGRAAEKALWKRGDQCNLVRGRLTGSIRGHASGTRPGRKLLPVRKGFLLRPPQTRRAWLGRRSHFLVGELDSVSRPAWPTIARAPGSRAAGGRAHLVGHFPARRAFVRLSPRDACELSLCASPPLSHSLVLRVMSAVQGSVCAVVTRCL